jgi:hypothetical protein
MSDAPKPESKPQPKRIDGPPKPPTRVTLDLMDESGKLLRQESPFLEMVTALTHAQTTCHALMRLNGGGRPLTRESLELSLDKNVVLLSRVLPKLEGEDVEMVKGVLREICDYRLRHPRTDASNREQAQEAQRVLDEIR